MNAEPKTVFCVWSNTDCNEGRGYPFVQFFCETKSTAIRLSKGCGIQGSNGKVTESVGYVIDGKLYVTGVLIKNPTKEDSEQEAISSAREAALEKAKQLGLTDEDIEALIRGK